MFITTALVIVSCIALAVVLAEVARRAASGRGVEAELRRSAEHPLPVARHRDRVLDQAWGRRAA